MTTSEEKRQFLFEEIASLAQSQGFTLLESCWLGSLRKHRFKHNFTGEIYLGAPNTIKRQGFPKLGAEYLQEIARFAQIRGFKLLESEWKGVHTKHQFMHLLTGEIYFGKPGLIKIQGFPKLGSVKLLEIEELAKASGFRLIDTIWLGDKNKYRFEHISTGEIYESRPGYLKRQGFPGRFGISESKLIPKQIKVTSAPRMESHQYDYDDSVRIASLERAEQSAKRFAERSDDFTDSQSASDKQARVDFSKMFASLVTTQSKLLEN